MPAAISGMVHVMLLSHVWDCFVGLRPPRNDTAYNVIARALVPAAISCMVHVMLLSHVWDCFVGLRPPRNDTAYNVIARALVPAAISCMAHVQYLYFSHVWDCFVGLRPPRNDTVKSLAMTRLPDTMSLRGACHCEGTCARGNLMHGTCTVSLLFSCLGLLRRASPSSQ